MINRRFILPLLAALSLTVTACQQNKSTAREIRSEADLHGLTVSTSAGSYFDNKYSKWEDVTLFRVNTESDGIQAVRQGIADVHVTDEVAFTPETRKQLGIKMAFLGEENFEVAFAVRKGNDELREQMDRFIAQSKADGSLEAVLAHYLEGTPAPEFPQAGEKTADRTPLRCITAMNMAPVCYVGEGGKWMGMDAEILQRFAAWSGRDFEMKFQDLGSGILALNTGQCDVVSACLYITDERKKYW